MSSELIGELGQVGLTIGQSPVSNNNTTTPVGCTSDESSPERKRQWSVTSSGRPVNRKRFRHAWLMFDIFKDWLRPHPSPELANCIVCNRVIKAGKSELEKHAAGKRHLSMLNGMNAGGGGGGGGAAEGRQTRGHTRHVVILDQDVVDVDSSYDGLKVVGMGLDSGLVHSEVVVMEEEMVVSSGTLVYQQQLPAVITAYNGNVLLPPDSAEITSTQSSEITQTVKFEPTSIDEMEQDIASSDDVSQEKVADSNSAVRTTALKLYPSMSLEELGCHDNNTVIEEEVCCQENDPTAPQKLKTRDSISNFSTSSLCKSYACTPDPGTATRRGGPGPTKRHSQRYRLAWEQFPEFKDWLTSHHNVYRAVCRICNKVLLADFTVIKAHATGRRHMYLAEKVTKGKQRLSTSRAETYLEENVEGLTVSSESGAMSGGAEGESSYKEDYDRNLADLNRSNSGAGGGGTASGPTQSGDSSQPNYTTGIYVPQQRNLPPPHNLSKAVVMSPAPNWKATAIVNGHVTRLDLSDYVGRYLILVFYPQDFSKICASEINALSDRSYEFRSIQTEIVACSVDSHLSHLTWSKLSRADGGVSLPKIPLIADPTHAIAKAYGVLLPDKGHTLRAHFIIDKRGILRHMSITDTLVGRGTDELLRIVKALQYVDEVEEPVPADWTQPNE